MMDWGNSAKAVAVGIFPKGITKGYRIYPVVDTRER